MDRLDDETEYVLIILHQVRAEITAQPQLFNADALKQIDDAIRRVQLDEQVKAA